MKNLLEQLYLLKRDKRGDYERPHKPALLLAVFDLFDRGLIKDDQVTFSDELRESFNKIFELVKKEDSKPTIQNPFFYLSGESFWNLVDENNQELYVPGNVGRAPSIGKLKTSHVELSEAFKRCLKDYDSRMEIREALISRYFPKESKALHDLLKHGRDLEIRENYSLLAPARSKAFADTVKKLYDYRCAACGERLVVGKTHFVDAAHIIPFSESYNDHPSNGMALCKNHHWAMDQKLIAPHPDNHWEVSERLDDRIVEHHSLTHLRKQKIILPLDKRFLPDKDSLAWRIEQMDVG